MSKAYHGTAEHFFWLYPRDRPLPNPPWDTYDADAFCGNKKLVGREKSGLPRFECLGHIRTRITVKHVGFHSGGHAFGGHPIEVELAAGETAACACTLR